METTKKKKRLRQKNNTNITINKRSKGSLSLYFSLCLSTEHPLDILLIVSQDILTPLEIIILYVVMLQNDVGLNSLVLICFVIFLFDLILTIKADI